MAQQESVIPNGAGAAAALAAGIGSFVLGLLTTLSQASKAIGAALNFYGPAGPLSGKTTVAVVVWLVAWAILHGAWKNRQVELSKVSLVAMMLVALGFLGTFPLFYDLFG
jgi:hypothetical protein